MPHVKIATLHNPAEYIINMIKLNCNNMDDLSKIYVAVESLIEQFDEDKDRPTIKQLLLQVSDK
jgi:hypothetical protein